MVAKKLVLAAHAAGEAQMALTAGAELERFGFTTGHDELELALIWALRASYREIDDVQARLTKCIRSRDASPYHRISAATWALKYADTHGDRATIDAVDSLFDPGDLPSDSIDRLEFTMVRGAVTGNLIEACAAARKLLTAVLVVDDWTRLKVRMNVSLVFTRAGFEDESVSTIRLALTDAIGLHAHRLAVRCSTYAASTLFDLNRDKEAYEAFEIATRLIEEFPELSDESDLALNRIDVALSTGNVANARQMLRSLATRVSDGVFRDRWQVAFAHRITQIESGVFLADSEVKRLLAMPVTGPTSGLRDFEVAVACEEMTRRGRGPDVPAIVAAYQATRPWQNRFSRCLQEAIKRAAAPLPQASREAFAESR
jgi:hypothetical protein